MAGGSIMAIIIPWLISDRASPLVDTVNRQVKNKFIGSSHLPL